MNDIIGFYKGSAINQVGMTLQDIRGMDNKQLEEDHHYIQWIFPLKEKSKAVPTAPILCQADIDEFKGSYHLKQAMTDMVVKMLHFYGMTLTSKGIVKISSFDERSKEWITLRNHNYLRLTRMIKSLNP